MHYDPLSSIDRIERTNLLANMIIDKALQSERGDIIRLMNGADLKMMKESVFRAVHNILMEETLRVSDYKRPYAIKEGHVIIDQIARFRLITDAEIEKEVSAHFEINDKLQYPKVTVKTFGKGVGNDVGKGTGKGTGKYVGKAIGKAIGKKASAKTLADREFFENNYKTMARGNYKDVIALAAENGVTVKAGTAKRWLKRAKDRVAAESV